MDVREQPLRCRIAWHGWIGLALVAICWPLNWSLPGPRTAYLFFPIWLGYSLAVDALVLRRSGTSLWTRSRGAFVGLFVVSAPIWWLFELLNWRTANWEYLGTESFSVFEYHALCTLAFSTVMPAVFTTAELVRTCRWVERCAHGPRVPDTAGVARGFLLTGLGMLALTLLWPRYFYPFVWTSLALIFEAVNRGLGRPHLLTRLEHGDWRPVVSLAVGALLCGFFWELWNYWGWPKWVYHTPGVRFLYIFEMPLPGYGGYVPFALELYGLMHFLWRRAPTLRL